MSKHRLLLDDDYEFLAYGMSCHWKDYRVAWLMNRHMNQDYHRESIQVDVRRGQREEFAKFVFRDHDNHLTYILLSNYNEEAYLFGELKQYDYFLLVEGYIDIFDGDDFQRRLKALEGIQYVTSMDTEVFLDIQYTLFEE